MPRKNQFYLETPEYTKAVADFNDWKATNPGWQNNMTPANRAQYEALKQGIDDAQINAPTKEAYNDWQRGVASREEKAVIGEDIRFGRSAAESSRDSLYRELDKEKGYWDRYRKRGGASVAEAMLTRQGERTARDTMGAALSRGGGGANQMRALREAHYSGERTMEAAFAQGAIARIQEQKEKDALAGQMMASIQSQKTAAQQLYSQALLGYSQLGAGMWQTGVADATNRYSIDTTKAIEDARIAFEKHKYANEQTWRGIGLGANVLGQVGAAIATGGASVPASAAAMALKKPSEYGKQSDYSGMPATQAYDKSSYTPITATPPKPDAASAGFTYGQPRGANSNSGYVDEWEP